MISFIPMGFVENKSSPDPRDKMRKIKYESELDLGFGEQMAAKAYGQKLLSCIQCGTCSSTCPLSDYMDYTPRKIIAMTREGFKDEVLNSLTIWLCSSCYACTVKCPRQIHITDVMYTLKREAIARGVYPKRYPIPIFSREFFNIVRKQGRNSEAILLIKFYLKTNLFMMFSQALMGLRLMRTGRFSFKRDKIERIDKLQRLLKAAESIEEVRT
ncbi:4Fe-4S dicluster domain-containing protein [bacterium]|nr:MAG: 4Fe-4S dicluster domain-containing protein [bacterium]